MFEDFKELKEFMIFCHTHYELNDVWFEKNNQKGIFFEGWHNNPYGNNKYSPSILPLKEQPPQQKRNNLETLYETWKKIKKVREEIKY